MFITLKYANDFKETSNY